MKIMDLLQRNGYVLRTTDGGINWDIIQAGDAYPLFCVDVIDSLHIAAAGYGGFNYAAKNLYSSDGGNNWITGDTLTTEAVNCIQYINPDTGYLVMDEHYYGKTTNRGQVWDYMYNPEMGEFEFQFLLSNNLGYSAGTGLSIYKTQSNYENWKLTIINDNFSDVYFTSENKGFALGNILYRTSDGGNRWQSNGPGGSCVYFIDSMTGFIGNPSSIWKTTNGGDNWYQTNGSSGASKIFFINENIGWAIRNNIIYKTTNKGENWFNLFSAPSSITFYNIHFIDSLYGWTANLGGRPYKTTNSGASWLQQTNLNIWESRDIYFRDSLNGFIINGIFELQRTTNSGANWLIQLNSQYVIRNLSWLSDNHGFIVGDGVYETLDSGNTWSEILELRNIGLRKFHSPQNYIGFYVGNLGLIYNYIDTTIVPVELNTFNGTIEKSIVVLTWQTLSELNNLGFQIERRETKEERSDNWENIGFINGKGTTTEPQLYSFTDKNLSAGKYQYRLKQIDYIGTFNYSNMLEVEILTPTRFSLEQNYPNPFNPSTKIKYAINETGLVQLKVYDILGKEIANLVNENKEAGYYSVEFDASHLPSGVYIYQLQSNSFISSKKMILIK